MIAEKMHNFRKPGREILPGFLRKIRFFIGSIQCCYRLKFGKNETFSIENFNKKRFQTE